MFPEDDIIEILESNAHCGIKCQALNIVLGLTGTGEGIDELIQSKRCLEKLSALIEVTQPELCEIALKAFVNLSSEVLFISKMIDIDTEFISKLIQLLYSEDKLNLSSTALMVLTNVTQSDRVSILVLESLEKSGGMNKFLELLNTGKPFLAYDLMASVLSNLTQLTEARKLLLKKEEPLIKMLFPYTTCMDSNTRRQGIVGAIRNCCFDMEHHEWLLGEEIDILPHLLLPLAGPDEYDEEDTEQLPLELQYLGADKKRDPNPEVRKMLIEALNQLCANKPGRTILKKRGVYFILRDLHKVEKNRQVVIACENVVDILIGDEPPNELENFKEFEIPDDLTEKFEKIDLDLLNLE